MKLIYYRSLFFCLLSLMTTLSSWGQTTSLLNPPISGGADHWEFKKEESKEMLSARSRYSNTFLTTDGRTILHFSKAPLNYKDISGKWQQVDPSLTECSLGWSAMEQDYPTYLYKDGSIALSQENGNPFHFGQCLRINGLNPIPADAKLKENRKEAVISNLVPGVDKQITFRQNAVEYNYVIRAPQPVSSPSFIITESVDLPLGAKLIKDENRGVEENGSWVGDLILVSAMGHENARFRMPFCYDAKGKSVKASYRLIPSKDKEIIEIIVPSAWLNDAERVYPVTIDPLVTGPTALWSGGDTPSCLYPSYYADSIQVTIPGGITVTGFYVTSNYFAGNNAVLNQGRLYYSTSCSSSSIFSVMDTIRGPLPGWAYLINYDMHTPLLCCYPQSCTPRNFYLVQHLGRTTPATAGCNMNDLYYDDTSPYPFEAYIEGHTVESYATMWTCSPAAICSNTNTITGIVYIRYGVPPYHIVHPWLTGFATAGAPAGCSTGSVAKILSLTIPGFPRTCDTVTVLNIPPPLVTDACGDTLFGLPTAHVHINETPTVTASSATVCSGVPMTLTLNSCIAGSTFNWSGNSTSGTTNTISTTLTNTTTAADTVKFTATATANGCTSAPAIVPVIVDPEPHVSFSFAPNPAITNTPIVFTDNSVLYAGTKSSWLWSFGDNSSSALQNPSHIYPTPGNYVVCLTIESNHGCIDSTCKEELVIPAKIVAPNIITPNGDNINDALAFKYLEYFGSNNLKIYDRWGRLLYEKENYTNDWDASGYSDGTYYYVLSTSDGKSYPGFVEVFRGK